MIDEDSNPKDPDDKPKKKSPSGPQKYKTMVKKPEVQQLAADTTKPLSPENPLMVEKPNGTTGQWGNPIDSNKSRPVPPVKKKLVNSDKTNGKASTFFPGRDEQQGPAIKTIKPSANFSY